MRIVWKHLPLDMHKNAPAAHLASVAAHKQNKFWEFHDKLFANQKSLDVDSYLKYARELGLDIARFKKDMFDLTETQKPIDADKSEAASLQVTGTPAFFVNGRYLSGAKPFEEFAALIDDELDKLGIPRPAPTQGE